jgi:DNA replication licensing factor MCM4
MYLKASSQQEKRIIHVEELKAYIRYARSLTPRMTDEAISDLITSYLSMRRINGSSGKTIGATTRQLESLIRLSEAHAKVR